eukprot:2170694-Amphidinium_carterae.1
MLPEDLSSSQTNRTPPGSSAKEVSGDWEYIVANRLSSGHTKSPQDEAALRLFCEILWSLSGWVFPYKGSGTTRQKIDCNMWFRGPEEFDDSAVITRQDDAADSSADRVKKVIRDMQKLMTHSHIDSEISQ